MIENASYTTAGTCKATNQDSVRTGASPDGDAAYAVVCDGVGGLDHGEQASAIAADAFARWFEEGAPSLGNPEESWEELIETTNGGIQGYGSEHGTRLATTLTGVFVRGSRYYVIHIGDCRAYHVRNGSATRVTEDQTFVAREVARGAMTAEEAAVHPKRGVILQALGSGQHPKPAFYEGQLDDGDLIVICCDGAYRKTGADCIGQVFEGCHDAAAAELEGRCRALARAAMDRGETDNVTVAALAYHGDGDDDATTTEQTASFAPVERDEDEEDDTPTEELAES